MEAEEAAAPKSRSELEADITKAMLARLSDFKNRADNLTLEDVRRALEKDLGMERLSLDAHKKFIKQCLQKHFDDAADENASQTAEENAEESAPSVIEQSNDHVDDLKSGSTDLSEKLDGSPVLEGDELDHKTGQINDGSEQESEIDEETIGRAMRKRAAYFKSNLDITLIKVRRLLEEDLELEMYSLDPFKKFIGSEMDEVLQSLEASQAKNGVKKEHKGTPSTKAPSKTSKSSKKARIDSESDSDSADVSIEDEEKKRPRKRPASTGKADVKGSKRQKVSTAKSKGSSSGKKRAVDADSEKTDGSDVEKASEDDQSLSSGEEEVKKKNEKPTQIYGKRVEQLKSTIKLCGMSIPPAVYKRVKQAPESKREAHLIKELEEILEREGLSANPSEKEIKAVKKRKQRAKDLEGIDMSNIVSSSRRRTTSFLPPPKPKIESESEESGEDEEGDEVNNEDSDEGNNDEGSSQGSDDDDAEEESD